MQIILEKGEKDKKNQRLSMVKRLEMIGWRLQQSLESLDFLIKTQNKQPL
jgi:hypothetical protein